MLLRNSDAGLGFLPSCSPSSFRTLSLSVSQCGRKRRNHRRVPTLTVLRSRSEGWNTTQTLVFHSVPVKYQYCIGENLVHNHNQLKGSLREAGGLCGQSWAREASMQLAEQCRPAGHGGPPGSLGTSNFVLSKARSA